MEIFGLDMESITRLQRVSLWDMKSGEANRKRFKFSIKYQLWKLFGIFGHVFSPALMLLISICEFKYWNKKGLFDSYRCFSFLRVQNEIIDEMRSHGLIGSHGFIVRLWILPSGLLLLKQALCLVSSQRVELDMAKIRKGVLRLAQISARIETRIVDELYLDLASIHPAVSGSANFMLVVHLDNRNISGNGGYLDMVFGLGWTGRSHLFSIEELLGKDHFGADYYLSISILKAIKRNVFLKKKELLGIIKCWYCGRRLRRQHLY